MSQCKYISHNDPRRGGARVRNLEAFDYDDEENDEFTNLDQSNNSADHYLQPQQQFQQQQFQHFDNTENNSLFIDPSPIIRRIASKKSPRMQCFYGHIPIMLTVDTGAEITIMSMDTCRLMGLSLVPSNQGANQVDNKTPLPVLGEVKGVKINKGSHVFILDSLVTSDDIGDILAGEPFLEQNDIAVRPAKRQIIIRGKEIISYANF